MANTEGNVLFAVVDNNDTTEPTYVIAPIILKDVVEKFIREQAIGMARSIYPLMLWLTINPNVAGILGLSDPYRIEVVNTATYYKTTETSPVKILNGISEHGIVPIVNIKMFSILVA